MSHFQAIFTGPGVTTGSTVSVIFALYTVLVNGPCSLPERELRLTTSSCSGSMVGAPIAAVLSDRYGRRKGMFCGAVVILIGMAIAASSSTIAQVS